MIFSLAPVTSHFLPGVRWGSDPKKDTEISLSIFAGRSKLRSIQTANVSFYILPSDLKINQTELVFVGGPLVEIERIR